MEYSRNLFITIRYTFYTGIVAVIAVIAYKLIQTRDTNNDNQIEK